MSFDSASNTNNTNNNNNNNDNQQQSVAQNKPSSRHGSSGQLAAIDNYVITSNMSTAQPQTSSAPLPPSYQTAMSGGGQQQQQRHNLWNVTQYDVLNQNMQARQPARTVPYGVVQPQMQQQTIADVVTNIPDDCKVVKQLMRDVAVSNEMLFKQQQQQQQQQQQSSSRNARLVSLHGYASTSSDKLPLEASTTQQMLQQSSSQPVFVHQQQRMVSPAKYVAESTGKQRTAVTQSSQIVLGADSAQQDNVNVHNLVERYQQQVTGGVSSAQQQQQQIYMGALNTGRLGMSRLDSSSDDAVNRSLTALHNMSSTESASSPINPLSSMLKPANSSSGVSTSVESLAASGDARRMAKLLTALQKDNEMLKVQLQQSLHKSLKVQQLELGYQKIQREYEELVRRQTKREELNQQFQNSLSQEALRLGETNRALQQQLDQALNQLRSGSVYDDQEETSVLKHELARVNMLLAQLMPQNKELLAVKERQDIELQAQANTLDEQRAHIQILDKALKNAQAKVLRLEEEREKKQQYLDRLEQLVYQLQSSNDELQSREEQHKQQRAGLEKELAQLQIQKPKKENHASKLPAPDDTLNKLRRELEDKDEQLFVLKQQNLEYEKRLCDLAKQKEVADENEIDSRAAHVAQLEEHLEKTERQAEETRQENEQCRATIRELKATVSTLENRVQTLEAQNAAKDAMINVLKSSTRQSGDEAEDDLTVTPSYHCRESDSDRSRWNAARMRMLQPAPTRRYSGLGACPTTTPSLMSAATAGSMVHYPMPASDYSSLGRPSRRMMEFGDLGMDGTSLNYKTHSRNEDNVFLTSPHHRAQNSCDATFLLNSGRSRLLDSSPLAAPSTASDSETMKPNASTLPIMRRAQQQRHVFGGKHEPVSPLVTSQVTPAEKTSRSRSADANILAIQQQQQQGGSNGSSDVDDITNTTTVVTHTAL